MRGTMKNEVLPFSMVAAEISPENKCDLSSVWGFLATGLRNVYFTYSQT